MADRGSRGKQKESERKHSRGIGGKGMQKEEDRWNTKGDPKETNGNKGGNGLTNGKGNPS